MLAKRVGATRLAREEFVVDDRVNLDGTCLYVMCKYMVV